MNSQFVTSLLPERGVKLVALKTIQGGEWAFGPGKLLEGSRTEQDKKDGVWTVWSPCRYSESFICGVPRRYVKRR